MKQWDEGFCPLCGVFLGDDYQEDHWCPFMIEEDEPSELEFDIEDDSDFFDDDFDRWRDE